MPWMMAAPVTMLMLLVLSAVSHIFQTPWRPIAVAFGCLSLVLLVLILRIVICQRIGISSQVSPATPAPMSERIILSGSMGIAGLLVLVPALRGMQGLGAINGSFDAFFHYSALQFVRTSGDAFPWTALAPMYADDVTFYPTGWHMLASLAPGDVISVANATALLSLTLWPMAGIVMLNALLPRGIDRVLRSAIVGASGTTLSVFMSGPTMTLLFGLWPNALALGMLPIGIAAAAWSIRRRLVGDALETPDTLATAFIIAGALCIHPSILVSGGVIAVIAMFIFGFKALFSGKSRRGFLLLALSLGAGGLGVVAAVLVLAPMSLLTAQEGGGPLTTLIVTVFDRPRVRAVPLDPWPLTLLLFPALAGVAVTLRRRNLVGAGALLLVVVAVCLSLATQAHEPVIRALAAPWYGARERVHGLYELGIAVLVGSGALSITKRFARHSRTGRTAVGIVASLALFAIPVTAAMSGQRTELLAELGHSDDSEHLSRYVTYEESEFIRETAERLPDDAIVLGDPRDGATMYWVLGGIPVVYPQLNGLPDTDARRVAARLDRYEEAPTVCASYRAIGAPEYLYVDTSAHNGDFFRSDEENEMWEGLRTVANDDSLVTPLYTAGPYVLYELELPCAR